MLPQAAAPAHLTVDIITILAIIAGPILAVWASEVRAARQARRKRQENIFLALMTTRTTVLATRHVEALNTIEIAFSAKKKKERAILDSWVQYLAHLGTEYTPENHATWDGLRETHLIDLLQKMGGFLSYNFDAVNLKKNSYFPKGHGHVANDDESIRHGMAEIMRGSKSFRMEVTAMPPFYYANAQPPTVTRPEVSKLKSSVDFLVPPSGPLGPVP